MVDEKKKEKGNNNFILVKCRRKAFAAIERFLSFVMPLIHSFIHPFYRYVLQQAVNRCIFIRYTYNNQSTVNVQFLYVSRLYIDFDIFIRNNRKRFKKGKLSSFFDDNGFCGTITGN